MILAKKKEETKDTPKAPEQVKDDNKILGELKEFYDIGKQYYSRDQRRMKLLDATDNGDLWRALGASFPAYQILTDTNFVAYVKSNLLASLYTVAKSAEVIPTSDHDKDITVKLSVALDHIWDLANVGYYQFLAGERAALLNLGITQVGWSETLTGGTGDSFYKGNVAFKNVDPMKFMRDPFAVDLEHAGWCCTYDAYHKSVFLRNPDYKEKFGEYLKKREGEGILEQLPAYDNMRPMANSKDHYNLIIFWVREGEKVNEIHTVDAQYILKTKEDIKPSEFPFAELYCNLPSSGLVGSSEAAKIFANNVAYNMLQSLAITSEYKNQRPPKFVNTQSGLNIAAFSKHGDEADRTFPVNGDASKAVHYHQFPPVSNTLPNQLTMLQYNMQDITGVDGKYTGRDTGSIITTGGTEEMLNRVTLVDTPKILNYERYTCRLTKLVLATLLEHAPNRKYFIKDKTSTKYKTVEVPWQDINSDTLFSYKIQISSELPKNKQRVAAVANMLMEKQMQYRKEGSQVELITEEEWLMMQDLPNKELMLERMGIQRDLDTLQEVSQVLFQYAQLLESGIDPNEAMLMTAHGLKQTRAGVPFEEQQASQMAQQMPTQQIPPEGQLPPLQ